MENETYIFQERSYGIGLDANKAYMLVADIGGTNSNFGIVELQGDRLLLVRSLHIKSNKITQFAPVVVALLAHIKERYQLAFEQMCIGAAGVVSFDRVRAKPTNLEFAINVQEIIQATGLKKVLLINDFEAVGYGLDCIAPKDIITVNKGVAREHSNKAILGAGTGLGKGILAWQENLNTYIPIASEGGHADCAVQDQRDLDLIRFIQESEKLPCNISWEDVLSGNGIMRIYSFLGQHKTYEPTAITQRIEGNGKHPDAIFSGWQEDDRCRDTFDWYAQWYARAAKNFALDALALAGVYIAGGIAAQNLELFTRTTFTKEFINCGKQKDLLAQIPIYIIADYNVSLYGAAAYMLVAK